MFVQLNKHRAQSSTEYAVLITVVLGALLAGQVYFKRGLQGKWKSAVDDVGEQYDPRYTNTDIVYSVSGRTESVLFTNIDPATNTIWTFRLDESDQTETKDGFSRIGASGY